MQNSKARRSTSVFLSDIGKRAGAYAAMASVLFLAGAGSVHDATASNETRTLSFHHTHSDEDITVTFKRNGRYDEEALKKLNHFLRDWRSQDQTNMDRRLFDILWEVYRDVDAKQPINIISSYRAPATNAMLRRRSSGVARTSLHMRGQAIDFFIPGASLADIRAAGLRLQRGGVGFYPTSGSPFVHIDTGNVRHWPRMNHDQLARVFPNGRTVHVPSDGQPLSGYQLALADIQNRGNSGATAAETREKTNFLTRLFNGKLGSQSDEDDEAPAATPSPETKVAAARSEATPLPRARPAGATPASYQVASATTAEASLPARPSREAKADTRTAELATKPLTPTDIINARGFWGDDMPAAKPHPTAAARRAMAAVADPQPTASLPEGNSSTVGKTTKALAYAPTKVFDREQVVAATSNPSPREQQRPTAAPGLGSMTATAKIASVGPVSGPWLRLMMVSANATTAMSATAFGPPDLTAVKTLFVKPQRAIAVTFSDDPQMGMSSERFSGSATAALPMVQFVTRTASLR